MRLRERAIVKASIGFGLGVIIGIVISVYTGPNSNVADGRIQVCAPAFIEHIGNALTAFVIQAVVMGLYGAIGMGGSVVYEIEEWSILRVTLTHFCGVVIASFTMAFYLRWFSVTDIRSVLFYLLFLLIPYMIIWLINYIAYRVEVNRINKSLIAFKSAGQAK